MKLYICPNLSKERYIASSLSCIDALRKNGFECYFSKKDSLLLFQSEEFAISPEHAELIVSIGGDGAVLNAAQTSLDCNKPLLGINGGRLGYLCAYELGSINDVTPSSVNALMRSKRSVICFKDESNTVKALNDIVIAKGNYGSVIKIDVACDGKKLMSFRGDGVIISTPTGSTSYNFSAGGPVLLPDSKCLAITPICPHLSDARTLVIPDTYSLTLTVTENPENPAYIYYDGILHGEACKAVTVEKYPSELSLLVNDSCSFVNNEKLHRTSLL